MAVKNNKSIDLPTLQEKLEKAFPDYSYEINRNALTVALNEKTKLNIVAVEKEFWIIEAVPYTFRMVVIVSVITIFAYWVQMQGWHWGINLAAYAMAFVILVYVANFLYGFVFKKNFENFKPKVIEKLKEIAE